MASSKKEDSLIELISDGDLKELRSSQLCTLLSECFNGNKAVIITACEEGSPIVTSSGVEQKSACAYEEHFYRLDPMRTCRSQNVALRMSDTVPKKRFESSEFYHDFFKPMDSYHSLSLARRISSEEGMLEVAINRAKSTSDFDATDKRLLKQVTAMLAARIGTMEARNRIPDHYRSKKLDLLSTLSERELEVFLHISSGRSLNKFTEKNNISINTARTLLKMVRTKLECDSQLELTKIARVILPHNKQS